MHEEDERHTNEKSHAYHFSITFNGCDYCLLTPPGILALSKKDAKHENLLNLLCIVYIVHITIIYHCAKPTMTIFIIIE